MLFDGVKQKEAPTPLTLWSGLLNRNCFVKCQMLAEHSCSRLRDFPQTGSSAARLIQGEPRAVQPAPVEASMIAPRLIGKSTDTSINCANSCDVLRLFSNSHVFRQASTSITQSDDSA